MPGDPSNYPYEIQMIEGFTSKFNDKSDGISLKNIPLSNQLFKGSVSFWFNPGNQSHTPNLLYPSDSSNLEILVRNLFDLKNESLKYKIDVFKSTGPENFTEYVLFDFGSNDE